MRMKVNVILFAAVVFFSLFGQVFAQIQPESLRQIGLLLQEKESRTPAQRKIQSQLLQAIRESHGKQMVDGLQLPPVNVKADTKGNLDVDISATISTGLLKKIEALGGKIIYSSKEYNAIRARVNLSVIDLISGFPEVTFIQRAVRAKTVGMAAYKRYIGTSPTPVISNLNLLRPTLADRTQRVRAIIEKYMESYPCLTCFNKIAGNNKSSGSVDSEGDRTHRADDARNLYGYTGKGIRIGVLSDSYNATGGDTIDVINGDLPGTGNPFGYTTPVTVVEDYLQTDGTDEGRAMLQIVHDIAPDAQLFFATGNVSEASFANNIKALRNAPYNCDVIIDDLSYLDEPVFQDGIVAKAVNTVTTSGALYFSSAGNGGSLAKGTSGVFEGDFNSTGSPVFNPHNTKTGTIHNFGTSTSPINGDIITAEGGEYTLSWTDAQGASANDYDLFYVNAAGSVIAFSTNTQSGTQNPFEAIAPPIAGLTAGDRLIVFKTTAAAERGFNLNTNGGILTNATDGQDYGHSCAINAFSVAATPAAVSFDGISPGGPYPGAFVSSNKVETFSSDGPRRIFYNSSGVAITAGNFLFEEGGGMLLNKPDITAADGVTTNVTGNNTFAPFFGTSAAAPHAGAIAALLKSGNPSLTAAQIRTILTSTALDIEGTGYDNNSGNGIVQAFQAMQSLNPKPLSSISIDTVITTEGIPSNGNGAIDPGETGKIAVTLKNPSLAIDSNVTSTITTTTAGVTITQGTAVYGNIASLGNAASTFTFTVSSSVPCGTVINFLDTVKFGGGGSSPQIFMFTVNVGSQPDESISSTLGSTPPTSPNFTSSTGIQTGRLNRQVDGTVSSCDSALGNPGLESTTGSRAYDAYKFTNTNTTDQCVTVIVTSSNSSHIFSVTYNDGGYVPVSPGLGFIADGGNSFDPEQYSFTAPAGKSFTVIIHAVTPDSAIVAPYTLNVSLSECAAVTATTTYTFTGNGNWDSPDNWLSGTIPPATLPSGSQIIINPQAGGECILNVSQTIAAGASIIVDSGKNLRILSNLVIKQ
jgi:hypothetical protein